MTAASWPESHSEGVLEERGMTAASWPESHSAGVLEEWDDGGVLAGVTLGRGGLGVLEEVGDDVSGLAGVELEEEDAGGSELSGGEELSLGVGGGEVMG